MFNEQGGKMSTTNRAISRNNCIVPTVLHNTIIRYANQLCLPLIGSTFRISRAGKINERSYSEKEILPHRYEKVNQKYSRTQWYKHER